MNENIRELEEKIAYLERHVTEQDKAMLELAEELANLQRQVKALAARQTGGGERGAGSVDEPDERPPHY